MPMAVEIVGVSAPAQYGPVKFTSPPVLYVSYAQVPPAAVQNMTFALRTDRDPLNYVPAVRQIVHAADPRIPVTNFKTQAGELASTINQEILLARICDAFAIVALVIACVGLYGTMAYGVARRTREIGIRIAIGARQGSVIWMMVRETLLLVGIGAVLGTLASLAANTYIAAQLFGVTPRDPLAIVVALSILGLVTLVAGYVPARHASRIDPVRALRAG